MKESYPLSRRSFCKCACAIVFAAPAVILGPQLAQAQMKLSKKDVDYQDHPHGTQQCSGCRHFMPPDACRVVEGKISPQGWCNRWQAASG